MKYVGTWFADRLRQPGWQNNLVEGLQGGAPHRHRALPLLGVLRCRQGYRPPTPPGISEGKGAETRQDYPCFECIYRCKTERDGANPIPEEVFKERKDFICIMNKNDNQ